MRIAERTPVEQLVIDPFAGRAAQIAAAKELPPQERVELLEAMMLQCEQVDMPLEHLFAHGVYMRKGTIPKGSCLIGHLHKTDHLNMLFSGRISVWMNGKATEIIGPCVFKAEAGVRKIIYAHEDAVLANIHGTHCTDLEEIENELIIKSETSLLFQQGINSEIMQLAESLKKCGLALEQKGG